MARRRCAALVPIRLRPRCGTAGGLGTPPISGGEPAHHPNRLPQPHHMGNRPQGRRPARRCHRLRTLLRLPPPCPRGRTHRRLLDSQAFLEPRSLHRSPATNGCAYSADNLYPFPHQRTFHRQPRLRQSDGEMRLRPHGRHLLRPHPPQRQSPPHPRPVPKPQYRKLTAPEIVSSARIP